MDPRQNKFTKSAFRSAARTLERSSVIGSSMPELPPGWEWMIHYPGGKSESPTAAAGLESADQNCHVYVEVDQEPGKHSLFITTGVAPAEVVAAVLQANRIKAPKMRRLS
jgi:hypothetical protein